MEIFAQSDIGLVRKNNEDACRFGIISDNAAWAVVCDGMGGAKGGNVASSLAVETVEKLLNEEYYDELTKEQTVDFLTSIVQRANSEIYKTQKNDRGLSGMGTTIELVFVKDNLAHVVHAGDSRVYGIRGNMIQQITIDHSVVQEMVDSGEITPEEALVHPNKNFITRALGVNAQIHLDYIEVPFEKGDTVIICTDGLTNYISMERILGAALEDRGDQLTQRLIETAKNCGGGDNITVAIIYA